VAYSQSKIKAWRRCQKQFAFRADYAPKDKELVRRVPKLALSRGSWMHDLLQAHNREWAGLEDSWEEVHRKNTSKFNAYFEEDRQELGDLPGDCLRLFQAYLRQWTVRDAGRYEVATLHNGDPAVEFTVEVSLDRWGIKDPFKGRLDLLVLDHEYGGLWIWDYKWVKRIPDVDDRMMSPQALLYAWALRKLGYDIRGFVYSYGRTKPPVVPHVLKRPAGMLSQRQNMDTDFHTYAMAIKQQHGRRWKVYARTAYKETLIRLKHRDKLWFRRERIPVEGDRVKRALAEFIISVRQIERRAKPHQAPRSYYYTCPMHCDYHDLCVTEFKGLDIAPLIRDRYQIVAERYSEEESLLVA
jgi:hypothetical protein